MTTVVKIGGALLEDPAKAVNAIRAVATGRIRPTSTGGIVLGVNPASHGLVRWDRFAQDNHNTLILARSGAGKSYLAKIELLRWLYTGVHATVQPWYAGPRRFA